MDENDLSMFKRKAEGYLDDGFFLKALALYEQLLRVAPHALDVRFKVVELSRKLGLKPQELKHLHFVARHHAKTGDSRRLRETLQTMVELEPENIAVRLQLMEAYAREGMAEEAGRELEKIGEQLPRETPRPQ